MAAQPLKDAFKEDKNGMGLYVACVVLMVAIFYLDSKVPLGIAVAILYNAVVLLALRSANKNFIVVIAAVATLFTMGLLFHKAPVDEMWKVILNRSLAVFSVWVACYLGLKKQVLEEKRANVLRDREKALEEVRVLRGFLPICASCKRIRDYQGSWTLLEKYISEHSQAEFSHGFCPECTKNLFPDLFHEPEEPHHG